MNTILGGNSIVQGNGFTGITQSPFTQGQSVTESPFSSGTKTSSALALGAGAAISALGSFIDIGAQGNVQSQIGKQINLANQQYDLQLQQIGLNKDIVDLGALKRANETYGTQLAQAGASAISPVSSAYGTAFQNTLVNKSITEFSNNLTATTQRLNTYFSKASFGQKAQERLDSSMNSVVGDILSGGLSIGAALALL